MVACTLLFEGSQDEVAAQERSVYALASAHGGMKAGAENGERGYQLTFAIAYIRDFMLEHWILAESFETSVVWSDALALCSNVKQRLWQEHAKHGLPGRPFVSARVTQLYGTGVCLYFYFGFHYKGVENPSEVFAELERAARDEILRSGGSLSHHHGVGKLRQPFLPRVFSPEALAWRRRLKAALDPDRLFGAGNG
jgi:alkyldihydroxyacetonephosphate synthase